MVDAPVKIVVVYHSGYDHAARLAEAVARGAAAISGASFGLVTAEEAPLARHGRPKRRRPVR